MTDTLNIAEVKTVRLLKNQKMIVTMSASSTATVLWKNKNEGAADNASYSLVASETKEFGPYIADEVFKVTCNTGSLTIDTAAYSSTDMTNATTLVGTQAAQPASGSVTMNMTRVGPFTRIDFKLNAARITVTDAGGSGSSGSLKLFDFVQQSIVPLGCRQDYTAFAEGSALTTAAGDAAFVMGVGSTAAVAADGALTSTRVDIGASTATLTNSGGTTTGTKHSGAGLNTSAALDGTTSPAAIYLNWSGTAATIDANSTIDVTGTVSVLVAALGDD